MAPNWGFLRPLGNGRDRSLGLWRVSDIDSRWLLWSGQPCGKLGKAWSKP